MVDVSGHTTAERGVHHAFIVQPEHVDAAVLRLVSLLSDVRQVGADNLANVLNDHLTLFEVAGCVEAESGNLGAGQHYVLAPLLLHLAVLGALGRDKVLAVGTDCLKANEEVAKVLGNAGVGLFAGAAALKVVHALDVRAQLGLGARTARWVDRQRKLEHRVAAVLEGVVGECLHAR